MPYSEVVNDNNVVSDQWVTNDKRSGFFPFPSPLPT